MPGTPMNQENSALTKLQTDNPQNGHQERIDDNDDEDEQQQQQQHQYRPEPAQRELTQTDKLNKRLLESLLERMSKSGGEFDRYMDEKDEEAVDLEEESSEF